MDQSKTLQATTQVSAEVQTIFEHSCYDCHSSQTRWPWYSNFAPVSWLLADHIKDGREELSFSEWGTYPPKKAGKKLEEICKMVGESKMPLKSYLIIHRDSVMSEADKQAVCNWTKLELARMQITKKTE